MFEEDEVQVLVDLGLTPRQAKVYLVSTKLKDSTARNLAACSRIPRQDVYQVLDELLKLGIVEKQIGTPTRFVAIPVQDVCTLLFHRKMEKTTELKLKMKTLIKNMQGFRSTQSSNSEPRLFIIPEKEAFVLKIRKSIDSSVNSIDIVTTKKHLDQALYYLAEPLFNAAKRGVTVRFIIEQTLPVVASPVFHIAFLDDSLFKVRTLPNLGLRFCIYDKKELSAVLLEDNDFAKSILLWSDCVSLAKAYQDHFDMLWHLKSSRVRLDDKSPLQKDAPVKRCALPQ